MPSARHIRQERLQRQGIGRGVDARRRIAALDPGGADIHRPVAQPFPDLAGEARDAGLAVGAGDGDDGLRSRPEPERGGMGERGARVLGDDEGDVRARQRIGRDLRARAVGQDRHRAVLDRAGHETRAMDLRAGKRREKRAGADLAAVDGKARDRGIGPGQGRQTQLSKGFGVLRHSCPRPDEWPAAQRRARVSSNCWIAEKPTSVQRPAAIQGAAPHGGSVRRRSGPSSSPPCGAARAPMSRPVRRAW
jgi:hypothetical protein